MELELSNKNNSRTSKFTMTNTTTAPEDFAAPEPRRDRNTNLPNLEHEFLEEGVSHISDV